MTSHIILGAGPAGVIAAETLRKHAPTDSITLVGDEPEPPYSRMAIPYLLIGNVNERGTYLRKNQDHFSALNINMVQGRASKVDAQGKTVLLDNGQSLKFDKLLIATGSTPSKAPISGMDLPGIYSCWTMADARKIIESTKPGSRVLQMGAGFIGCIIMEALAARGVKLSVVEMGDRMVPRMMGPAAGSMIKSWCESKGVAVYTGAKVESISAGGAAPEGLLGKLASAVGLGEPPSDAPLVAKLSTGQRIEADVIISATGVKPTIGFLSGSGINCKTGVLTDDSMQTNVPGVYAAGDCAEAFDNFTGQPQVSAIQPNAADQARVAALNMLGRSSALKQVTQINVLDTLGLISSSFGSWQGVSGGESAELVDKTNHRLINLQFKDDVLVGCNSIGWTEHVGVMRGLVEGKVHLGGWKDTLKADPTKLTEAYIACAQASSQWSGAADERRR
jgi:NAD(P)H-nitrite reductase large subunit